MAAETQATAPASDQGGSGHGLRIFLIWIVLAVVADLLLWFGLGPHIPPGNLGSAAASQQFDNNVLIALAAPVTLFVLVYFTYALIVWRRREGDTADGPALHGNARIQTTWITVTSVIVLFLAAFGTYELIVPAGAGGGEGPSPIWNPPGAKLTVAAQQQPWSPGQVLVVQVIGQQWRFTYRYPQFGGFQTTELMLPKGSWVQFDVTSIDVIHSFWAYQLGVKADANPGVDNVAYSKPLELGRVTVRCAELCGLWHGAMFDYGYVVSAAKFQQWAQSTQAATAAITATLPPYATTYNPAIIPDSESSTWMIKQGLNSAGGGYYPPQDPQQP